MSTLYQPPQESRLSTANHLVETLQLLPSGTPWFCVGDFNDLPDENMLVSNDDSLDLQSCFAQNLDGSAAASRWSSNRCIGYAITNAPHFVRDVQYDGEAIADHKIFCCRIALDTHFEPVIMHRFVEHDDLSKPDCCSLTEWHQACCDFLTTQTLPQPPPHCNQQTIDCYWRRLNFLFEGMSRHAKRSFKNTAFNNPCQLKGQLRVVHANSRGKLDHATDTWQTFDACATFDAKLLELSELEANHRCDTVEYQRLKHQIDTHPLYDHNQSLRLNTLNLRAMDQARLDHCQNRISTWKHRLQQSSRLCFKWLKRPVVQPFRGLISSALQMIDATTSFTSSLELLRDHWRQVWHLLLALALSMRTELSHRNFNPDSWGPIDPVDADTRKRFSLWSAGPMKFATCHLQLFCLLTFTQRVKHVVFSQVIGKLRVKRTCQRVRRVSELLMVLVMLGASDLSHFLVLFTDYGQARD